MPKKIAVLKQNQKIIYFGYQDMSQLDPKDYDIVEIMLENLPDNIQFCRYVNGQVVVDKAYKQEFEATEELKKQEKQEAKQRIGLEELAGLTYSQLDNYIDNNVTNLASARQVLKKLAKWNLALTKYLVIRKGE